MKFSYLIAMTAIVGFATSATFADSNASGGGIVNSETQVLGPGPFNHGGPVGNAFNTTVNVTFTGGFLANRVRFIGTATSVDPDTFGSEADIRVTLGGNFFNWQNPGPIATYTTFDYNSAQTMTGALLNANPAGTWAVQFYDSFDDDPAGPDSISTNVTMVFEEFAAVSDSNGNFSAGTLTHNVAYNSVGEFAVPQPAGPNGNNDRYTFNVLNDGWLTVGTTPTAGFTGNTNGDTEIGIFDAAGNIVPNAFDDDGGSGLYSQLNNIFLTAGSYTLIVGDFATNFSNASNFGNLTFGSAPVAGYDYGINFLFFVPEPSTFAVLGLVGLAISMRRKRA